MRIEIINVQAANVISEIEKIFDYEDCVFSFGYLNRNFEEVLANVLYVDKEIVGCALIQNDKTQDGEDISVILSLEILPSFNRKGLGKKLANHIIYNADKTLYLDAYWDAVGFWKSIGFRTVEEIGEDDFLENVTEMYYTK